ncbi:hypothetical protein [Amycolatopsis thermoflava]|uniref:hypothetical protein n=1 Tax=Amycolatopsis thermoflava TaxID=84480 RepID=UPI003D7521BD
MLAAFGVRTLQHQRRTGRTGFHGIKGRPGSLEWWGGALFALALLLGLLGPHWPPPDCSTRWCSLTTRCSRCSD